ncbi:hypothetical protein EYR40_006090 [Pleurotus pulmonarius]|nr:hypothetical protein EYR36_010710 [Pleurotus pulmonarius]KAF4599002.1 hypothetical protein EYR40_006090 [Pleurotus pulmonarius]
MKLRLIGSVPVETPLASSHSIDNSSHLPPSSDDEYSDDEVNDMVESFTDITITRTSIECTGVIVEWTPGSVWDTYPYQSHGSSYQIGWSIVGFESNKHLRLRALACTTLIDAQNRWELNARACTPCLEIPNSSAFISFMRRAEHANEHTPYSFLSPRQLLLLLVKSTEEIHMLRTRLSNQRQRDMRSTTKLNDYKRILILLSENNIPSLRRLLSVALRNNAGTGPIIERLKKAINGVYSPLGQWSERELDIAFLCKALGGSRLLYVLSKFDGYPSTNTIQKRYIPRLIPSISAPSLDEINGNIVSLLGAGGKTPQSDIQAGVVLMMDGIALEEVCRYNTHRDSILGLCREHSGEISTTVTGEGVIKGVAKALYEDKTCHHGKDGTVVALATISGDDNYSPIPLLLSPSCKTEKGDMLASWLERLIDAYSAHEHGQTRHGPIWTIASDGESTFRAARFHLCMSVALDPQSPLGQKLLPLNGLNVQTGKDGILATCDPKHVIKRFATLLRNANGIQIDDTTIVPSRIIRELSFLMSPQQAEELLNPADKQNVPKAVGLIQSLGKLETHKLPAGSSPSDQHHRRAIIFLAKVFSYFVQPFINITMSLSKQIKSLATYAHLITALFVRHGTGFMTGALYADSQAIVKNIIFTTARLQLINANHKYFILLEGTDRLELIFSDVRTQDHSRNVDVLQLAQKLSVGAEINAIFSRHPDLDRGHRRLNLAGAVGIDHINPKSWVGNVRVGDVDLLAEWTNGRDTASRLLAEHLPNRRMVDFNALFAKMGVDILRPKGVYVGTRYDPDDERTEAERQNSSDEADTNDTNPNAEAPMQYDDAPLGMDIEDFLEAEEVGVKKGILTVDGKTYYKSSMVAAMLTANGARKVTQRPLRAQGLSIREALKRSQTLGDYSVTAQHADTSKIVKAGDIIGCLVRTSDTICLAAMEVLCFEHLSSNEVLSTVTLNDLDGEMTSKYCVACQTLDIVEGATDERDDVNWLWTSKYINYTYTEGEGDQQLTQRDYVVKVPGFLVYPLDPSVVVTTTEMAETTHDVTRLERKTWSISREKLDKVLISAWDSFDSESIHAMNNLHQLPYLPSSRLPYKNLNGDTVFYIADPPQHLIIPKLAADEIVACKLCGKRTKLSVMRNHVGHHILYSMRAKEDSSIHKQVGIDPCGWCGEDGCMVQLIKKGKANTIISNCAYHYERMSYGHAIKCTPPNSPCTNVPIHCPTCPITPNGQPKTIWKYNAIYHLISAHAVSADEVPKIPLSLLVDMFVSKKEEQAMGINCEATNEFREANFIPDSDGLEVLVQDVQKRARAPSSVSNSGARKVARRAV